MDILKTVHGEIKSQVVDKTKSKFTITILIKYLLEGFALAIAAYVIPNKKTKFNEIAGVTVFAALSLFLLDLFSGEIATGARFGAGVGVGLNLANAFKVALPIL